MPRMFFPKTLGDPGESVSDTVPQIDELHATIGTWRDEIAEADGDVIYRIVGLVPADGRMVYATFVPDTNVAADPDKRWVVALYNTGPDGGDYDQMTEIWDTGTELTAMAPVEFEELPPPVGLAPDELAVERNDVIVWAAQLEIDPGAEDATAPPRPTGHITVGIRRSGGS